MRLEAGLPRSFDRSSPVHAYWLAHCEGFRVRSGRRRGVVEDVARDSAGRASHLVVRYGLGRRSVVPVEAAGAVVPAEEEVVLVQRQAPPSRLHRAGPRARRAALAAGRGARAATRASAHAAAVSGRATDRGAHAAWRGARRRSAATWLEAQRVGRWLAPRLTVAAAAAAAAAKAAAAWTAATAVALADWARAEGPPAARAIARRSGRLAAQARAALSAPRTVGELPPAPTDARREGRGEQDAPPDRARETAA